MKGKISYIQISKFLFNKTIGFICLLFLLSACKKGPIINNKEDTSDFQKIFIQFWDKMNTQYIYWNNEIADWNLVYKKYYPLFKNLNNSDEDKIKAAEYFKQMTSTLIDNHYQITFQDETIRNYLINPALERKTKAKDFHERFNYDNIVKSYLDKEYISGNGNITENGKLIRATTGTFKNEVLYFHCNFFSLKQTFESCNNNKVKDALDYFFSMINSSQIKGIILDLRNNEGGNIADLNFFAGKLIDKDHVFGFTRNKNGLGKFGYLPWIQSKLNHDPAYDVNVPIILLGDNYTASLAEIMIISLKSKKNIFIGEQTYGATGAISDPEVFNSGSFTIGNFLTVRTTAVEFKGIDGQFYENIGIRPDIFLPSNLEELYIGKDAQLELAISQFK